MLLTFIIMSVLVGAFLTFIWSSNGGLNVLFKVAFFGYTVFGVIILIGHLFPEARVQGTAMRWW